MKRRLFILLCVFIIIFLVVAGCISPTNTKTSGDTVSPSGTSPISKSGTPSAGSPGSGTNVKTQPGAKGGTVVTTPPQFGSLKVTSSPYGADVYVEGTYAGKTTYTIQNLSPGKLNISLKLNGYASIDTVVTIVANKETTYAGTLKKAQTKLSFKNLTSSSTSPCIFDFYGNITNDGDIPAQGVLLILTATPRVSDPEKGYIKSEYRNSIGVVGPKQSRFFGFNNIHLACGGDFTVAVKFEGVETDPFTPTQDKKLSGSATFK